MNGPAAEAFPYAQALELIFDKLEERLSALTSSAIFVHTKE